MSVNQANSRMLRALAKTLRRESDHSVAFAERQDLDPGHREAVRAAAAVGSLLGDACNEAANELDEQTRREIEGEAG